MVIFVKPDGTTIVSNDSIGIGSHVGMVEIVAPTRAGAFVELLLQLPSGLVLPPEVCTPRSEISSESIGVYTCTLSRSVTSEAGRVVYQVRFTYADGQIELTPGGSFVIQSGVVVIPPDEVSDDAYEEIKNLLATINANYAEILERFDRMEEENAELNDSLGSAVKQASESAAASINSASQARSSETNAKASESNAKSSETAASKSAESAAQSAAAAAESEKVASEAKTLLEKIPKLKFKTVDALPSADIDANTIYLRKGNEENGDRYSEHLFVPTVPSDDATKKYDESEGAWERIGGQQTSSGIHIGPDAPTGGETVWVDTDEEATVGASGEIPFFDLAEMGLPEVPGNGTTANLTVDTTEIKSALDNGCVKFAVNAEDTGRVEIVMNKYSVDAYGIYLCLYNTPDGAFMLMIADGSLQASVVSQSTIPPVTSDDNGKVLTVVDGVWSLATPTGVGTEIPTYDLTAMGLSTVTVGGGFAALTTDTTQLRNDLISGSVKLTLTMALGDYTMPISKICNAVVVDGAGEMYITFVAHIAGMVVHTSLDILDGRIQARSETLKSIVTPYIDAYMEDALGGDY